MGFAVPWVKLDDQYPDHPKVRALGALGLAIQTAAICFCGRYLTDGILSYSSADALIRSVLSPITKSDGSVWTVALTSGMSGDDAEKLDWKVLMVEAGLWEKIDGGYRVHDYLDYNPSKREYLQLQKKKRVAGQAGGQASAQARALAGGQAESKQELKQKPTPYPYPSLSPKSKNKRPLSGSDKPDPADEILTYLNSKTGNKYRPEKSNLALIQARLASATVEQIQAVIDAKVTEWRADPKMRKFLRPSTLFRATNFEQYLGQVNNGQPLIGSRPAVREAWKDVKPGEVKL